MTLYRDIVGGQCWGHCAYCSRSGDPLGIGSQYLGRSRAEVARHLAVEAASHHSNLRDRLTTYWERASQKLVEVSGDTLHGLCRTYGLTDDIMDTARQWLAAVLPVDLVSIVGASHRFGRDYALAIKNETVPGAVQSVTLLRSRAAPKTLVLPPRSSEVGVSFLSTALSPSWLDNCVLVMEQQAALTAQCAALRQFSKPLPIIGIGDFARQYSDVWHNLPRNRWVFVGDDIDQLLLQARWADGWIAPAGKRLRSTALNRSGRRLVDGARHWKEELYAQLIHKSPLDRYTLLDRIQLGDPELDDFAATCPAVLRGQIHHYLDQRAAVPDRAMAGVRAVRDEWVELRSRKRILTVDVRITDRWTTVPGSPDWAQITIRSKRRRLTVMRVLDSPLTGQWVQEQVRRHWHEHLRVPAKLFGSGLGQIVDGLSSPRIHDGWPFGYRHGRLVLPRYAMTRRGLKRYPPVDEVMTPTWRYTPADLHPAEIDWLRSQEPDAEACWIGVAIAVGTVLADALRLPIRPWWIVAGQETLDSLASSCDFGPPGAMGCWPERPAAIGEAAALVKALNEPGAVVACIPDPDIWVEGRSIAPKLWYLCATWILRDGLVADNWVALLDQLRARWSLAPVRLPIYTAPVDDIRILERLYTLLAVTDYTSLREAVREHGVMLHHPQVERRINESFRTNSDRTTRLGLRPRQDRD